MIIMHTLKTFQVIQPMACKMIVYVHDKLLTLNLVWAVVHCHSYKECMK